MSRRAARSLSPRVTSIIRTPVVRNKRNFRNGRLRHDAGVGCTCPSLRDRNNYLEARSRACRAPLLVSSMHQIFTCRSPRTQQSRSCPPPRNKHSRTHGSLRQGPEDLARRPQSARLLRRRLPAAHLGRGRSVHRPSDSHPFRHFDFAQVSSSWSAVRRKTVFTEPSSRK